MNVEHLMTRNVVAVSPETPLKEVAAILADRGISGLPVCDAPRHVVGVVSEADILRKEQGLPPGRSSVFDWLFGRSDEAEAAKLAARTAG
jgi:CBS domain-containing protein